MHASKTAPALRRSGSLLFHQFSHTIPPPPPATSKTPLTQLAPKRSSSSSGKNTTNTNTNTSSHHLYPHRLLTSSTTASTTTMASQQQQHLGGRILKAKPAGPMGLKQLFEEDSCTYTYLLWDLSTKDAILVDPVDVKVDRDLSEAEALGLNLVWAANTHAHADHVTGTGLLKQRVRGLKSVISEASGALADAKISHGDRISFGNRWVGVLATPGHTEGCVSLVADDGSFVLTGDALLVQGCGRTDFQGGCPNTLYGSVHDQLFSLGDETVVYPAHDYKGRTHSTIGAEREKNPRLGREKSREEFVEIMKNLNLSYPKKIDVAVPANMRCGVPDAAE